MDDQSMGYSGSESYRYVEPLLKDRSRELLVISPYIGMGYAKLLVSLARRKKVRVITSSYSQIVRDYILHRSRNIVYSCVKADAALAVCTFIAVYFSFYLFASILAAAIAIFAIVGFARYLQIKGSDIKIRTSYDRFVHEKAYISESVAVIGSANLTYSGLRKNVERVEVIRYQNKINALRAHFWDLWRASK